MQQLLVAARWAPLYGLCIACLGFIAWAGLGLSAITGRITAIGLIVAFCGMCLTLAARAAWRGQERLAQATILVTLLLGGLSLLAVLVGALELTILKQLAGLLPGGDPFSAAGPKFYRLPENIAPQGGSVIIGPPSKEDPGIPGLGIAGRLTLGLFTLSVCLSLICLLVPRKPERLPAWGVFSTYIAGGLTILISLPLLLLSLGILSHLPGSLRLAGGIGATALLAGSIAGIARLQSQDEGEQPQEPNPVSGFYEDPYGQSAKRYWDGQSWTSQTK